MTNVKRVLAKVAFQGRSRSWETACFDRGHTRFQGYCLRNNAQILEWSEVMSAPTHLLFHYIRTHVQGHPASCPRSLGVLFKVIPPLVQGHPTCSRSSHLLFTVIPPPVQGQVIPPPVQGHRSFQLLFKVIPPPVQGHLTSCSRSSHFLFKIIPRSVQGHPTSCLRSLDVLFKVIPPIVRGHLTSCSRSLASCSRSLDVLIHKQVLKSCNGAKWSYSF